MTRSCPTCRAPLAEDARFCGACGVRLSEPSEAPTATSLPQAAGAAPVTAPPASGAGDDSSAGRFLPGQVVAGRYRIVGLLGRGGMGEVYRADDLKLGQPVALKFLPEALEHSPDRLSRFLGEARTARQIAHPNVCRVYDVGEADGRHFLSMEYVDGEDLATLLRRIGYIPADKAVQIGRQLCAGLAAAHAQGFLHRDLKPANVMIDGHGRVRITDFGLAGLAESFEGGEIRAGTPQYMAPEQLTGEAVSVRSDLYALGLVLYEICTGVPAFSARTVAELTRLHRESSPASPTTLVQSIDPAMERVILRCLEKRPEDRPATALEVAASLPGGDPLAAALAAGETPSPEMVAAAGGVGALPAWIAILVLVLGLAGLVAVAGAPGTFTMLARVEPASTTETLRARARSVAADLGWERTPRDTVGRYGLDGAWVRWQRERTDAPDRWDEVERVRPAPYVFWYRESPEPLVPSNYAAHVTPRDPPETEPGMVRIHLDPDGRLLYFLGITKRYEPGDDPGGEPDWSVPFRAAGLDLDGAESIEPAAVPRTGVAVRRAWRAAWTDRPDERVRVEATAFGGRLTSFEVVPPWEEETWAEDTVGTSDEAISRAAQIVALVVFATILAGGVFLARRNIRLGRGNRRGAFRLAIAVAGVSMAIRVLTADHVASLDGVGMLVDGAAYATMIGVIFWMVYLALEPYVRRIWPDALIAWSRLLDGRLRDPLVGRDVLLGAFAGVLVAGTLVALDWVMVAAGEPPAPPRFSPAAILSGPVATAGAILEQGFGAAVASMAVLFLAVLLTMIVRNRWIAAGLVWVVFTTAQALAFLQERGVLFSFLLAGILWGAMLFVLLRRGILAIMALLVVANLILIYGRSLAPSSWYFANQALVVASVVAILLWGAVTSLAGQRLLHDPLAAPGHAS